MLKIRRTFDDRTGENATTSAPGIVQLATYASAINGEANRVAGADIANQVTNYLIDQTTDRRSYTLSWAGTTTSLHLNNADLMQSGRVIKSMVIRDAAAGSFKIGNRSVLDYYTASVTTVTTKPTTVALTNITWDWTDGRIVFTPLSSYYGTITVDIEFVDNPSPSYVTSEETLTLYAASLGYKITDTGVQSTITSFFEAISGGRNTVKFTADGVPGIYVKITPTADPLSAAILAELGYSDSSEHPVWKVGGVTKTEIYIAKYGGVLINVTTGTIVANAFAKVNTAYRLASLKMVDPVADITFDESIAIARQNGTGFHCITNAEWSYLYLRSLSLSHEPRGNNDNGKDYIQTSETGTLVAGSYDATDIRTLTGAPYSGWSHDNTAYGVMDLNGNVWEWVAGSRTNNGEIQIIPDNDAALSTTDVGVSSSDWKAILEDGSEVTPGTALTLKWDHSASDGSGNLILKTAITYYSTDSTSAQTQFNAITATGITPPSIIKALGYFPLTAAAPTRGRFYDRNNGERLTFRGGAWFHGSDGGVAALVCRNTRGYRNGYIGARSAFVE